MAAGRLYRPSVTHCAVVYVLPCCAVPCCVQVTVGATLQLFGHAFQVPLSVQNLQFHARVRTAAQVSSHCLTGRRHAASTAGDPQGRQAFNTTSTQHLGASCGLGLDLREAPMT